MIHIQNVKYTQLIIHKILEVISFTGKHDLKSTFGDISLVAKGQLYVNYAGYAFVQDEDCDYTFRKCQVSW